MSEKKCSTAYTGERQDKYYDIEDVSWWFLFRAKVFVDLAKKYLNPRMNTFDIGGSNGFNAIKLQDAGFEVSLLEPTKVACDNAVKRGVNKVYNSSFQDYEGEISQFMCLDVIEHIKDDKKFLIDLHDKCSSNTYGIIAAPAYQILWSSEDEIDGHFRRYTKKDLLELLNVCGFEPVYSTYCFEYLWLPIFIRRHLMEKLPFVHKVYERTREEEDEITKKQFLYPRGIAGMVLRLFEQIEFNKITSGKTIPYGSSIIVVVRSKND